MKYKLQFVQKFQQDKQKEFLELERKFMLLEKENDDFPKGKRFLPITGCHPENTIIWECEFESLKETLDALEFIKNNDRHEELFNEQVKYFEESYVQIYQVVE